MVNVNLDTGVILDTFLANFDREGVEDGRFYDWIPDVKAKQFQGFDEKCTPRSLNGRCTDAHQVVSNNASAFATAQAASDVHKARCNAAGIVYKEQQDFHVGHDGGYMIQYSSPILTRMLSTFFIST